MRDHPQAGEAFNRPAPFGGQFRRLLGVPRRETGKNETIEACLVREASEELGVSILPERLFCQKEHGTAERRLSLFFFFCRWVSGEPRAIDCKDFRWISKEELRQPVFLPGDTEVLKDLALHWEEYFKTGEICR